jgi:hypothetical protein
MQVAIPPASKGRTLRAYDGRKRVPLKISRGLVTFTIEAVAGQPATCAVKAQPR